MTDTFQLVEEAQFYAPVATSAVDVLLSQYSEKKKRLEYVYEITKTESVIEYFLDGYRHKNQNSGYIPNLTSIFNLNNAIGALNAFYWKQALDLTDVYNTMPQKRRDEWNDMLREHKAPEFTENSVQSTLLDLLSMRSRFLAERVDGLFRNLSREHVTNVPEGFSKRMIIAHMLTFFDSVNSERTGYINDLRSVIAKFMGRDEIRHGMSYDIIGYALQRSGQWIVLDGGALKIRVYKKGTAHLEIHPEIAYRLNQVLAGLYPSAIPSQFRTKPAKKNKEWAVINKPLSFAVVDGLRCALVSSKYNGTGRIISMFNVNSEVSRSVLDILVSIGGVRTDKGNIEFDYHPYDAINEIIASGVVPDKKTYQFYPTPTSVAEVVIEMADIKFSDRCLEPSAGQGALADMMKEKSSHVTCVEISKLHSTILKTKGFFVFNADFIQWKAHDIYDKIVMNPPFSEGRWLAHVKHALTMLADNGVLVAILPSSAKNTLSIDGYDITWSETFCNEFAGTSINTIAAKITKII